jgi:FlaA1/EpsC-like NDP-sugar epimerase
VEYTITKRGIDRKNYLLVTYMNELIELYNLTKSNIELFIDRIAQQNIRNCIFYGAGETARVIITVLDDMSEIDFKLICLVDDDTKKQGGNFLGYKIVCPEDIEKFNADAVIITSCIYGKEIRKKLKEADYPDKKIIDFFM